VSSQRRLRGHGGAPPHLPAKGAAHPLGGKSRWCRECGGSGAAGGERHSKKSSVADGRTWADRGGKEAFGFGAEVRDDSAKAIAGAGRPGVAEVAQEIGADSPTSSTCRATKTLVDRIRGRKLGPRTMMEDKKTR